MNAVTKPAEDVVALVGELGRRAKAAAVALRNATTNAKNRALNEAARQIRREQTAILAANTKDTEAAKQAGMSAALLDRLLLDETRVEAMAKGLDDIAALPDPVGARIEQWTRPNGLSISRVRVPIGIIGVIYEARPNVTADAGALCIKSGNTVVLRGGSDSFHSSRAIVELVRRALSIAGLPEDCVQLVPTTDRAAVGELLRATGWLDLIVPRGGRSLIDRVTEESRVPVLRHYDGICHVYVDRDADIAMARDVVANAKMRRVSVCGAAETLLVDRAALDTHLMPVLAKLHELGCEVRGDADVQKRDPKATPATEKDWRTEYLSPILAIRVVDGVDEAIAHIGKYGSAHTDSIVTENYTRARKFLREVDSSSVMVNASTRFADGYEYGLGAEIGISTDKFHARGPVGIEGLTSMKWVVLGHGEVR